MSTNVTLTFGKGASSNTYSIDIIYIFLIFIHIASSKEFYSKFILKNNNKNRKEIKKLPIEDNRFMKKFESKTLEELDYVIEASQFSKEAKTADKELIKRKIDNQ